MVRFRGQSIDPATSIYCRAAYNASQETGYTDGASLTTVTDLAVRGLGLTLTANGAVPPTWEDNELNGHAVFRFDGANGSLLATSAADWRWLHSGQGVTIIALVKLTESNPNRLNAIVDTCGGSSSNRGLSFYADDRSGVSKSNALSGLITRPSFTIALPASPNEVLFPQRWTILTMRYQCESNAIDAPGEGRFDCRIDVDGISVAGANAGNLPHDHSNDPTFTLAVGRLQHASPTLFAKMDLACLYLMDYRLNDDELAGHYRWLWDRYRVGPIRLVAPGPGYNAFPGLVQLPDKTLVCGYYAAHAHTVSTGGPSGGAYRLPTVLRRSGNKGWDWSLPTLIFRDGTLQSRTGGLFLTSGGVLLNGNFTHDNATNIDVVMRRSTDWGRTWTTATVTHNFTTWSASETGIVELSNGNLLAPLYGLDVSQTFTSCRLVSSSDGGATWGSSVTIVDGQAGSKNCTEPQIIKISGTYPNETLVCVFRNDTASPLRLEKSTSTDSGATWGVAASMITSMSGKPAMLRAASGNIYLLCRSTTSPNRTLIRWSSDDTATWSATDFPIDPMPAVGDYAAMIEIETGYFLVVYAREATTQSNNPTMSTLCAKVFREADITNYT